MKDPPGSAPLAGLSVSHLLMCSLSPRDMPASSKAGSDTAYAAHRIVQRPWFQLPPWQWSQV